MSAVVSFPQTIPVADFTDDRVSELTWRLEAGVSARKFSDGELAFIEGWGGEDANGEGVFYNTKITDAYRIEDTPGSFTWPKLASILRHKKQEIAETIASTKKRISLAQFSEWQEQAKSEQAAKDARQVQSTLRFVKSLTLEQQKAIYFGLGLVHGGAEGITGQVSAKAVYGTAITEVREGRPLTEDEKTAIFVREHNKALRLQAGAPAK